MYHRQFSKLQAAQQQLHSDSGSATPAGGFSLAPKPNLSLPTFFKRKPLSRPFHDDERRLIVKIRILVILALFLLLAGCSSGTQSENPKWVDQLIRDIESETVGNPPQSIWRYEYLGQIVYYLPPQCCDQFSTLYDAAGDAICAPDGGLTGTGDGQCADFITERTGETLIWADPGTR